MGFRVLDATAFYAGTPFRSEDSYYVTASVYDEIKHIKKNHMALEILLNSKRLIIQDPDGSGLLQGGTEALIDAIGSATGQDATPQVDDDLNIIENPDLDLRRIKPPETLRYTFGFALVFGGPGAAVEEGFKNILKLVSPEEE